MGLGSELQLDVVYQRVARLIECFISSAIHLRTDIDNNARHKKREGGREEASATHDMPPSCRIPCGQG